MSQPVGLNFKSRIPQLQDDASIEEALRVYHYGIDNYTSQEIPKDSIEGNFRDLDQRLSVIESTGTISVLKPFFIEAVSETSSPNVITPQNSSTIPLTIRGTSLQSANLQQWQNSASANVSVIFSDGAISTSSYLSVGNVSKSSTNGIFVQPINSSHRGILVRGTSGQTGNLQEWQNSSSSAVASVEPSGNIYTLGNISASGDITAIGTVYSNNKEVVNLSDTQNLTNKSLVIKSGETLESFRARNIQISTSSPSGGNDGDIWIKH